MFRQLKDIAWGSGAILVGSSARIDVMALLSVAAGTESIGVEDSNGLKIVGLAPLTGFISASVNTRELAPLIERSRSAPRSVVGSPRRSAR